MRPLEKKDLDLISFVREVLNDPEYPAKFTPGTLDIWEATLRYHIFSEIPDSGELDGDPLLEHWVDHINYKFLYMHAWQTVQRHRGYISEIDPIRAAGLRNYGNIPYPNKMKRWLKNYLQDNIDQLRIELVSDRKIRDHLSGLLAEQFPFEKTPDGRTLADWMRKFGGVYKKKPDLK